MSNLTQKVRGFSLIEVLIAILVLSTGMLALAALQSSITRNSVSAKARSQAVAAANDAASFSYTPRSASATKLAVARDPPGIAMRP